MSTELEEALVLIVQIGTFTLAVWAAYGMVAFWKLVFNNPSKIEISGDLASDNIWTKNAAQETAKGNIEVAKLQLKIENSQRERAGLPPIR